MRTSFRRNLVIASFCAAAILAGGFTLTPGGSSYIYYLFHRPSAKVKMIAKEGMFLAEEGRFDQQALVLEKGVSDDPGNFIYKLQYAEALAYAGDTRKAQSVYQDIIKDGGMAHREEVAAAKKAINGNNLKQSAITGKQVRADFLQKIAKAVADNPNQKAKIKRDGGIRVNFHFAKFTDGEMKLLGL